MNNGGLSEISVFELGPAHIIANSFSPAPAIWAAVERPELVHSLVLDFLEQV
jgi:hypothetical protein